MASLYAGKEPNPLFAVPQYGQATDEVSDSENPSAGGSFCCLVASSTIPSYTGLVTVGHNFTEGEFRSMNGFLSESKRRNVLLDRKSVGRLRYQRMASDMDLAIVELQKTDAILSDYISFKNGFYTPTEADIKTKAPNVTVASRINPDREGSNIRDAYILKIETPYDIKYGGEIMRMQNVILIGSSNVDSKSKSISLRGDSGSCVYRKDTAQLLGILIGANEKYTFVLPIKEILNGLKFTLL